MRVTLNIFLKFSFFQMMVFPPITDFCDQDGYLEVLVVALRHSKFFFTSKNTTTSPDLQGFMILCLKLRIDVTMYPTLSVATS